MSFESTELHGLNGFRVVLPDLSIRGFFTELAGSSEFRSEFTEFLTGLDYDAIYWEMPVVTRESAGSPCEFVVIDAPGFQKVLPNYLPFADKFFKAEGRVTDFKNLKGDSHLVVPVATKENQGSTHLLAFLREAPSGYVSDFWERVAEIFQENLNNDPLWVSTAGLGVHWLHVRFDRHPKYYRFSEYK